MLRSTKKASILFTLFRSRYLFAVRLSVASRACGGSDEPTVQLASTSRHGVDRSSAGSSRRQFRHGRITTPARPSLRRDHHQLDDQQPRARDFRRRRYQHASHTPITILGPSPLTRTMHAGRHQSLVSVGAERALSANGAVPTSISPRAVRERTIVPDQRAR